MRRATRLRAVIAVALLLVLAVPVYLAPYRTVAALREAAHARDSAKLPEYVDFPALRESLKLALGQRLEEGTAADAPDDPFARFAARLASAVAGPFIDAMITPGGIELLLAGQVVDLGTPPSEETGAKPPDVDLVQGYEGPSHFVVTATPRDGSRPPLTLVFRREGLLTWKLAGVRLP